MVSTNDVNGTRLQLPPHVSAAPSGECCRLFVVFHEQHLAHDLLYPGQRLRLEGWDYVDCRWGYPKRPS